MTKRAPLLFPYAMLRAGKEADVRMKNSTKKHDTAKKAAAAAALFGHIVFCVYQSLFCFYNGSGFISGLLYKCSKKLCFAVFEVSEDMLLTVAPWWLLGMACTAAVIAITAKRKAAGYLIPVSVTFAAAVLIAVICGNGYYFPTLPYGAIYAAAGVWFLFDTVMGILYFKRLTRKRLRRSVCDAG